MIEQVLLQGQLVVIQGQQMVSGSTTSLTVGDGTMSQLSGTYYVFRETSGQSQNVTNSGVVMRSPEIELKQGDKIESTI